MKKPTLKGMTPLRCFEAHTKLVTFRAKMAEHSTWDLDEVIRMLAEAVRLGLRNVRRRRNR